MWLCHKLFVICEVGLLNLQKQTYILPKPDFVLRNTLTMDSARKEAIQDLEESRKQLDRVTKETDFIWRRACEICDRLAFLRGGVMASSAHMICTRAEIYLAVLKLYTDIETKLREDVRFMENVFDEWYDIYGQATSAEFEEAPETGSQSRVFSPESDIDIGVEFAMVMSDEDGVMPREDRVPVTETDSDFESDSDFEPVTESDSSEDASRHSTICEHWEFSRFFWKSNVYRSN